MTTLPLTFWCFYLTQLGQWRQEDWNARSLVCGLKQEPFKGELRRVIQGRLTVFKTDNIEDYVRYVMPKIGERLRDDIEGRISIVPIPNSNVVEGTRVAGRTLKLAEMIAEGYGNDAEVIQAIKWDEPRQKAHKVKDYRTPALYQPHMRLVREPQHRVVIFDDVVTTGSQMIAGTRLLRENGFRVRRGLAIAKAVQDQRPGAFLTKHEDELEIDPPDLEDEFG